jgi:hypothetical protein
VRGNLARLATTAYIRAASLLWDVLRRRGSGQGVATTEKVLTAEEFGRLRSYSKLDELIDGELREIPQAPTPVRALAGKRRLPRLCLVGQWTEAHSLKFSPKNVIREF